MFGSPVSNQGVFVSKECSTFFTLPFLLSAMHLHVHLESPGLTSQNQFKAYLDIGHFRGAVKALPLPHACNKKLRDICTKFARGKVQTDLLNISTITTSGCVKFSWLAQICCSKHTVSYRKLFIWLNLHALLCVTVQGNER